MAESRRPSLPRKVWVGQYEFSLRCVPRDHAAFNTNPGEEDPPIVHGVTHFNPPDRGIYIADDLGPRELFEVVWHEICHAVNYAAGIEDGAEEELIAEHHGMFWTQILLDNPRLQRWVTGLANFIRKERTEA